MLVLQLLIGCTVVSRFGLNRYVSFHPVLFRLIYVKGLIFPFTTFKREKVQRKCLSLCLVFSHAYRLFTIYTFRLGVTNLNHFNIFYTLLLKLIELTVFDCLLQHRNLHSSLASNIVLHLDNRAMIIKCWYAIPAIRDIIPIVWNQLFRTFPVTDGVAR